MTAASSTGSSGDPLGKAQERGLLRSGGLTYMFVASRYSNASHCRMGWSDTNTFTVPSMTACVQDATLPSITPPMGATRPFASKSKLYVSATSRFTSR